MKGYFIRWKRYGWSCAGHTLQGYLIGLLLLAPNLLLAHAAWPMSLCGVVLAICYLGYQAGSGARKIANQGKADSIGWDIADLSVGIWAAVITWLVILAYRAAQY